MTIVAVVGLGYVGLPLAVEFGKKFETIGFDLSEGKIANYKNYCDPTGEVSTADLKAATRLSVSTDPSSSTCKADFIIIAVPTPVDDAHIPDFSPLVGSSTTVGKHMKKGATVVYESTVYPGATEEVCIPLLEQHSGMKWKQDFHVGYSPERVNPGDKERTITRIVKVVSGDDGPTSEAVAELYASVITAGVHRASSIKVAEAAKVIENTQRDLNIALMNELALIFDRFGIDTLEVLQAAGTKWNFLPFRPGLVGGHCIGVDPYYLTHKAEMLGYHPQVILAGRRINDGMAAYVAQQTVKGMINNGGYREGQQGHRAGPDLQGKLPGSAQFQGRRSGQRIAGFRLRCAGARPNRRIAGSRARIRHQPDALGATAERCRRHRGGGFAQEYLAMSLTELTAKLRPGGVFTDVKSAYDQTAIKAAGFKLWRL
jgi:UDP-N-acetyl-D-glucosamine/UDP-N-acetyl-D-galactosamine dehydrogenase